MRGNPTVEGALHVFLDTDLDLSIDCGEGWRNYAKLGAQVTNTPEWGAELMDTYFDPVVLRLIGLLKRALPGCDDQRIFWGYHFVTGADADPREDRSYRQIVRRRQPIGRLRRGQAAHGPFHGRRLPCDLPLNARRLILDNFAGIEDDVGQRRAAAPYR